MSENSDCEVLMGLADVSAMAAIELRGAAGAFDVSGEPDQARHCLECAARRERERAALKRAAQLVKDADEKVPDTRTRLWSANDYHGNDEYFALDSGEMQRRTAEEYAYEGWEARGCPKDDPPTVNEYALVATHVVEVEADGE